VNKKYNILTVVNEGYAPFIKLFVNSLFEYHDLQNVDTVYVFDTGLSDTTKKYLLDFPKVKVVDSGINSQSSEIHDEGWKKSTYSKTKFLLNVLEDSNLPTIMIDADSIFYSNFEHLLDWDCDFVACHREREGFSKYIGSFFGALDVEKSKQFINLWIKNIDFLQNNTDLKHCESPALAKTIEENPELKCQDLPEQLVSAIMPDESSTIFHLKSDYYAITIEQRLNLPHSKPFARRYL
tara:strand:- start:142 stop:855 length:714 start_codon:yes stop_codon:yes gene_type:complete